MPLETGSYIDDLVPTNPTGTDQRRQGDDHVRLLKSILQNSFPNINGAVTATPADLNKTSDLTNYFPSGGIIMWSGSIATIPTGWALCNGTGTAGGIAIPNLLNKFIIGADADSGGTSNVNATGGSRDIVGLATATGSTALNESQMPAHTHSLRDGSGGSATGTITNNSLSGQDTSAGFYKSTSIMANAGSGAGHTHSMATPAAGANLPPYYALAYIVKL